MMTMQLFVFACVITLAAAQSGTCLSNSECSTGQQCTVLGDAAAGCPLPSGWKLSGPDPLSGIILTDEGLCTLRLTGNVGDGYGVLFIPITNQTYQTIDFRFQARLWGGSGADGFSVNWGPDLPTTPFSGNPCEEGYFTPACTAIPCAADTAGVGLSILVDSYDNYPEDTGIGIKYNGTYLVQKVVRVRFPEFVDASFTLSATGLAVFKFGSSTVSAQLPAGYNVTGDMMFGARTGGAYDQQDIRNVRMRIQTATANLTYGDCRCFSNACPYGFSCVSGNNECACDNTLLSCCNNSDCKGTETCILGPYECFPTKNECPSVDSVDPSLKNGCGYVGDTTRFGYETGLKSIYQPVQFPFYEIKPNTGTFLCVRSYVDLPRCDAAHPDFATVSIPNQFNFTLPCHNVSRWSVDAWKIPPVSNLKATLRLDFLRSQQTNPATYWGVGVSEIYVTRVDFLSRGAKDLTTAKYIGQVENRGFFYKDWNDTHVEVCNVWNPDVTVLYNFFDKCANRWIEQGATMWNTQTQTHACYCTSPAGSPHPGDTEWIFPVDYEYFLWYGTCAECLSGPRNDTKENTPAYVPRDHLDDDLDGVPNKCDRCKGYSDFRDEDSDGTPDACDKCSGYPDYIDNNNNFIPDGCDLCELALDGCRENAECTNGPETGEFSCKCDEGFRIAGDFVQNVALAAELLSKVPAMISWVESNDFIRTSNLLDLRNAAWWASSVNASSFTIKFGLKQGLENSEINSIFRNFVNFVKSEVANCASCGTYDFSFTWKTVGTEKHLTVWIQPFATSALYSGLGLAGENSRGCTDLDECALYKCDENSDCFSSGSPVVDGRAPVPINKRLCVCKDGFIGSQLLTGSEKFPGCQLRGSDQTIDQCRAYPCKATIEGRKDAECEVGPTPSQRTCTCAAGYHVPSKDGNFSHVVLNETVSFDGCVKIDFCVSSPCGKNTHCVSGETAAECLCLPGYLKSENPSDCFDPCTRGNGGCQSICNSPNGTAHTCSCADPHAKSVGKACVCKTGYFGDGNKCAPVEPCKVHSAFGSPFVNEAKPVGDGDTSDVCMSYSESSCCNLNSNVFSKDASLNFSEGDCNDNLERVFCSFCDPKQNFFTFSSSKLVYSLCPDSCQALYRSCVNAKPNLEGDSGVSITTGFKDFQKWCEEKLVDLLPFGNQTSVIVNVRSNDRRKCFNIS